MASTISTGQTVCVRQTASSSPNILTTATLTVGTFSATFSVITQVGAGFNTPPQVTGGYYHSLGLRSDGTLFSWGGNSFAELGDGTTASRLVPGPALMNGVVQVVGGYNQTLALRADGTVWSWGRNNLGQLGDGTTTDRITPVQALGLTNVTAIATDTNQFPHSLALKSDGTVWAWGFNSNGQLGNGTTVNSSVPVQVSGLTTVTAIAAGRFNALALKADGTVGGWG